MRFGTCAYGSCAAGWMIFIHASQRVNRRVATVLQRAQVSRGLL